MVDKTCTLIIQHRRLCLDMDFRFKTKWGVPRDVTCLQKVLNRLGVKTLEEAISREREKVKANGFIPIQIEPEPSSLESRPSPITVKPRLPYADDSETF